MLKVVSNTTSTISLLKIERLSILQELYSVIHIPKEVYNELEKSKNKGYYTDASKLDWIKIVEIKDEKSLSYCWIWIKAKLRRLF